MNLLLFEMRIFSYQITSPMMLQSVNYEGYFGMDPALARCVE